MCIIRVSVAKIRLANLFCFLVGLKHWKTSRRVKAMKLDEFQEFQESQDFEEPLIKTPRGGIPELPYHRGSTQRGKGKIKIDDGDDDYNLCLNQSLI